MKLKNTEIIFILTNDYTEIASVNINSFKSKGTKFIKINVISANGCFLRKILIKDGSENFDFFKILNITMANMLFRVVSSHDEILDYEKKIVDIAADVVCGRVNDLFETIEEKGFRVFRVYGKKSTKE